MSPMKHQQLINLISRLDLPTRHIRTLGEDLKAIRCGGIVTAWTDYLPHILNGHWENIYMKYGAATS